MSPAPIVISTSPGRASSSNVAMIWSREAQNRAACPRAAIRVGQFLGRRHGFGLQRLRGPQIPAQSGFRSPPRKLSANSDISAFVRET